jgi:hypothetical protein
VKINQLQEAIKVLKKKNDSIPAINPVNVSHWCIGNQFYGKAFMKEEAGSGDGYVIDYFDNEVF